jgi:hypothetical protein
MTARVYVDFNELVEPDVVLLSQQDTTLDSDGNLVALVEGMKLGVYTDDLNERGQRDDLVADGVVARNTFGGWASAARWVLKIDGRGIRNASKS